MLVKKSRLSELMCKKEREDSKIMSSTLGIDVSLDVIRMPMNYVT